MHIRIFCANVEEIKELGILVESESVELHSSGDVFSERC
jgi:hypothetical protein